MQTHKWLITGGIALLAVLAALALATGLTRAQEPAPQVEVNGDTEIEDASSVAGRIPVQGRLTDASGNPLDGTFNIKFRLYDALTAGTLVCQDTNNFVSVNDGLFYSEIWGNCTAVVVDGRQLYLEIEVESDGAMTPRQPIYPVPYAYSLRPGAIISASHSGDAIVHIENWGETGRGLRVYAMDQSSTNFGIVGASRSVNGYGGYFYNNGGGTGLYGSSDTGVAIRAGGNGVIQSVADTTIAVSPLKMVPDFESRDDLDFLADGVYMEIRPDSTASAFEYVQIPVDIPSVLFGTPTKLKSVRVCYRCDQAGSFVTTTIVGQGTDSGTLNNMINNTTNRTSTSWDCYTVTDTTPNEITGSVYVQLSLELAGTGSAHDIRIGNIALTLTEE
jgi:hypothetical protein